MLISLVACFIAAGSFIGYNFSENNHNMDVSLADISVMAQADGESGNGKDKKLMQGSGGTFCCCPGSLDCGAADCATWICDTYG